MAVRTKRVAVRNNSAGAGGAPPEGPPPAPGAGPSRRRPTRTILLFLAVALLSAGVPITAVLTRPPLTVVAVAGNLPMFEDPVLRKALRDEGLDVRQTAFGTRKPQDIDLTRYDLVVSGSEVQAKLVAAQLPPDVAKRPWFSSPMVVVTREPLTALLQKAGVARTLPDGAWEFDVAAYLRHVQAGRRWIDIRGDDGEPLRGGDGRPVYPSPIAMLVNTTDPRLSNSAAMFVAIVSYLSNDNDVVQSEDVGKVLDPVRACFEPQGDMPSRTPDLMDKFLSGDLPTALVYENDFLAAKHREPALAREVVAMYPTVNVSSDNTLISQTPGGVRLAELLLNEGPIRDRARRDWGYTDAATAGRPPIVASVSTPKQEILERIIDGI